MHRLKHNNETAKTDTQTNADRRTGRHTEGLADRQSDRHRDRQIIMLAARQIGSPSVTQAGRQAFRQRCKQSDSPRGRQTNCKTGMYAFMQAGIGRQTDRQTNGQTVRQTDCLPACLPGSWHPYLSILVWLTPVNKLVSTISSLWALWNSVNLLYDFDLLLRFITIITIAREAGKQADRQQAGREIERI